MSDGTYAFLTWCGLSLRWCGADILFPYFLILVTLRASGVPPLSGAVL